MTRVAVCLSGCGVQDGSEIHESVLTLLALDRAGAEVQCCAPDVEQMHVVNHLTGEEAAGESRNVLVESARIARGEIRDVAEMSADDFDALILPGGFGAAKNLCDFATRGAEAEGHPEVLRLLREAVDAGKPVGLICIAPAVCATAYRGSGTSVELTIGTDRDTGAALEEMGAQHVEKPVDEIHEDTEHKIVTTPAYMLAGRISEAAAGIEKLVRRVVQMCRREG